MKKIAPGSICAGHDTLSVIPLHPASAGLRDTARAVHSPAVQLILEELRREIPLLRDASEEDDGPARRELEQLIQIISVRHGFELSHLEKDEILLNIEKEQRPFGILQPLVDDFAVTDIIITSFEKISIQHGRKNLGTSIRFPGPEAYEAFVERLLAKSGTTYSTKKPITDGMIGSFARVHAVHRALCECDMGPYVTIRLNRFPSVILDDLLAGGLAPAEVLNYLSAVLKSGNTLLIAGEVGTGKTTLARALASGISEQEAILVIEDTPEIRLDHPHVRYIATRETNTEGAGRVSPAECIRAGMRMAANRIIFGEIRDAEAAEAFIDVCASGHPGLSTIHARSAIEAVSRLQLFLGRVQRGVDPRVLNEQIATAVHVIVHTGVCRTTGCRRVLEVKEIGPVADGALRQRDIFQYHQQQGFPAWRLVNRVSAHRTALEGHSSPVNLSHMPGIIELDLDIAYRESAARAV